jgi:predicted SnoaL-like aldol condensation-catalyzing enzyme
MKGKPMRHASNIVLAVGLALAVPALAENTPTESANKKVVLDFYAALNEGDANHNIQERIPAIAEKFLSPQYTQHTLLLPGTGSDRDKFVRMFQGRPAMPAGAPPMPRQRTDAVMAEGDRVMLLTSRDMPDPATGSVKPVYVFNMFRLKDGKLVEHWDINPAMGPPPAGPAPAPAPGR